MNEAAAKLLEASGPQLAGFAAVALFLALLIGLIVGIRMRKQILTQAAEELLATPQFATAAKVEGEKHLRSVQFQEAVLRTVNDDAKTQSGIIAVVVSSADVQAFIDRRIDHRYVNHDLMMDAKIRESQERMRREVREATDRIEGQLNRILGIFMDHIQAPRT